MLDPPTPFEGGVFDADADACCEPAAAGVAVDWDAGALLDASAFDVAGGLLWPEPDDPVPDAAGAAAAGVEGWASLAGGWGAQLAWLGCGDGDAALWSDPDEAGEGDAEVVSPDVPEGAALDVDDGVGAGSLDPVAGGDGAAWLVDEELLDGEPGEVPVWGAPDVSVLDAVPGLYVPGSLDDDGVELPDAPVGVPPEDVEDEAPELGVPDEVEELGGVGEEPEVEPGEPAAPLDCEVEPDDGGFGEEPGFWPTIGATPGPRGEMSIVSIRSRAIAEQGKYSSI